MGRFLAGAVVALIIASIAFFFWTRGNYTRQEDLAEQIAGMNNQLSQMRDENDRLKAELSKVQGEEQKLAAQNDELLKAIASVKATGKLPADIELELNPPK